MHVLVKLQSVTEHLSIEFEKDGTQEHQQGQQPTQYIAKTCILNQNITGSIMVKMLMWLPYKKANISLSEMFDLTAGGSNYICNIECIQEKQYIVDIRGHIKQKLRRFIRDDSGTNVSFHFRLDAEHKKDVDNVLVLSENGQRQWKEQMQKLIYDASHQICDKISTLRNKSVHIHDIHIYPLPNNPPWEIQLDSHHYPTKVKIHNTNYPIKMDIKLKVNGLAFIRAS
jgi:hypothetical protein